MTLEQLVRLGLEQGASDLHLEGGLPLTLRVGGQLRSVGEPLPTRDLLALARSLLQDDAWNEFMARASADLSRTVAGVRCRINILRSARGVGFALRLLSAVQPTLKSFNLHPELGTLVTAKHGLLLVSGPTGSGKTSTLAALLQEINLGEARHIITLESPIEYALSPRRSFIRQREIGRDSPSFRQALIDALREDPDVIMVGEMRDPETMQLTLNAAETGHLVLASMHSSSAAEALQRLVSAFAPESQSSVCAQLAECLVAVVAQRLTRHPRADGLVAECELLRGSVAARSVIRQGAFSKLQTVMESGAGDGHLTSARYREWLDKQNLLPPPMHVAAKAQEAPDKIPEELERPVLAPRAGTKARTETKASTPPGSGVSPPQEDTPGVLVIDADEDDPSEILSSLVTSPKKKPR